jgi:hypothetical protein
LVYSYPCYIFVTPNIIRMTQIKNMSKKIKVRFNLGRGQNYMKWKIQYPSGEVEYVSPTSTQLVMKGCTLKNNKKTAQKIFDGEHKTVCAWILCDSIDVKFDGFDPYDTYSMCVRLKYNPRENPNWIYNDSVNADNLSFIEIGTVDYKLFVTKF